MTIDNHSLEPQQTQVDGVNNALQRLGTLLDRLRHHTGHGIAIRPHLQLILSPEGKEPVGAEVLARFHDEESGDMLPLPLALGVASQTPERMFTLSRLMLEAAATAASALSEETRNALFRVWVNTPGSGVSKELIQSLAAAARNNRIPPHAIGLEILEGDRRVDAAAVGHAMEIKVPFALDDLGSTSIEGGLEEARKSGIIALLHQAKIIFHKVKVDRSLRLNTQLYRTAICRLAHLFPEVTVEGIEHSAELEELTKLFSVIINLDPKEIDRLEDDELSEILGRALGAPDLPTVPTANTRLSVQGYIDDNVPRPLEDVLRRLRDGTTMVQDEKKD